MPECWHVSMPTCHSGLSQIWLSDSDWAGAKDLGAVRFKMDPDVLMEAPGWPHELHTFEKVVLTDPQLTEKGEK